jgi:hypothetical protein
MIGPNPEIDTSARNFKPATHTPRTIHISFRYSNDIVLNLTCQQTCGNSYKRDIEKGWEPRR